jgi:hypothetical protein
MTHVSQQMDLAGHHKRCFKPSKTKPSCGMFRYRYYSDGGCRKTSTPTSISLIIIQTTPTRLPRGRVGARGWGGTLLNANQVCILMARAADLLIRLHEFVISPSLCCSRSCPQANDGSFPLLIRGPCGVCMTQVMGFFNHVRQYDEHVVLVGRSACCCWRWWCARANQYRN